MVPLVLQTFSICLKKSEPTNKLTLLKDINNLIERLYNSKMHPLVDHWLSEICLRNKLFAIKKFDEFISPKNPKELTAIIDSFKDFTLDCKPEKLDAMFKLTNIDSNILKLLSMTNAKKARYIRFKVLAVCIFCNLKNEDQ